jgi:hypothetical protein
LAAVQGRRLEEKEGTAWEEMPWEEMPWEEMALGMGKNQEVDNWEIG